MNRIKANQIANGYLSEGIDEGINPEYFLANEAQAGIDELVDMLENVVAYENAIMASPSYKHELRALLAKHKGE